MIRALAILPLLTAPGQAAPCDSLPPPSAWQVPTVGMEIDIVPAEYMTSWCHKLPTQYTLYGCTYPARPGHNAVILLNADLTSEERVCVLLYEEAHLPPNNWFDPVVEASAPDDPTKVPAK